MTKPFSSLNVSDGLNRQEIYLQPEQSFRAYEVYLQASDARVVPVPKAEQSLPA